MMCTNLCENCIQRCNMRARCGMFLILPHRAPEPVKVRIRSAPLGHRPSGADLDRDKCVYSTDNTNVSPEDVVIITSVSDTSSIEKLPCCPASEYGMPLSQIVQFISSIKNIPDNLKVTSSFESDFSYCFANKIAFLESASLIKNDS